MSTDVGIISNKEYEDRLQKIQELAGRKGLNALIAFSSYQVRDGHVAYLTNHRNSHPNIMSHKGLGHAALIIPMQGKPILIAPGGCDAQKITNVSDIRTGESIIAETAQVIKKMDMTASKVGIAGLDVIPTEYYLQLQRDLPMAALVSVDEMLENQRLLKSPSEILLLQQAAQLGDTIMKAGLEAIQPGVSGWQVEQLIRASAAQAGADLISHIQICSGKSINVFIWPQVNSRIFEDGDFVLLKAAGWYHGYGFECSRITVAGKRFNEQQDYLEHIAEAAEWMIGTLKVETQWTYYMAESRSREIHAEGNGIGLEICEKPWIRIESPIRLKPGMVLYIKPTVTSHNFGRAAIGDMVLVTEQGVELMSHLPRIN